MNILSFMSELSSFKKCSLMMFFLISATISADAEVPSKTELKLPDPLELVRSTETQYMGKTSKATARMIITTSDWTRKLTMEFYSEGRDKMLARIINPAKERGVSTLKTDEKLWNYVPKIDRIIRIPPGLMGDAWMGSHMTNDDLVKANKIDELYELKLVSYENDAAIVEALPRESAAVVWGKVIYYFEVSRKLAQKVEYYNEEDEMVRKIIFEKPSLINDKWIPMLMTVIPVDKEGESTIIEYEELKMDVKLPRNIFSLAGLRRH